MDKTAADLLVFSLLKYVTNIDEVKGLGFCVSIEHAEFMCRYFNDHLIPSIFLTGKSSNGDRKTAKGLLVSGKGRFIFVVDIYVDIPEINTVLFLRSTEALTFFLKQLDVFFVTLNKADKNYSPTTMYHDYSINENLFHWQSQSTTVADSPTGQRYIHHQERGSKVLLFV